MDATDQELTVQRVDTAIRHVGLFVRVVAYAGVAAIADHFECGRALLTGMLAGDLLSRVVALAWEWCDNWLAAAAELALLALVFLFVRRWVGWPDDAALRAIAALAGFSVFSAQTGGAVFTRLGPSEDGFA